MESWRTHDNDIHRMRARHMSRRRRQNTLPEIRLFGYGNFRHWTREMCVIVRRRRVSSEDSGEERYKPIRLTYEWIDKSASLSMRMRITELCYYISRISSQSACPWKKIIGVLFDANPRRCEMIHQLHLDHPPLFNSSPNKSSFWFFLSNCPEWVASKTELVSEFTIEWSIYTFALMTISPYVLHRLSFITSIHLLIVS